jgi:hypothetical protein
VQTKAFKGEGGKVKALSACRVDWKDGKLHDVPGSEFELKADLVLFAMGYLHPVHEGMLDELGVGILGHVLPGTVLGLGPIPELLGCSLPEVLLVRLRCFAKAVPADGADERAARDEALAPPGGERIEGGFTCIAGHDVRGREGRAVSSLVACL